jgi:hypothetical protein
LTPLFFYCLAEQQSEVQSNENCGVLDFSLFVKFDFRTANFKFLSFWLWAQTRQTASISYAMQCKVHSAAQHQHDAKYGVSPSKKYIVDLSKFEYIQIT